MRPERTSRARMKTKILGQPAPKLPSSPEEAILDRVPNPHPDENFVARFTCPEFTSLCPVTGQPDFGIFVIDYVPDRWLLESKSLKLFLFSFRNHGAFHEDCTSWSASGSPTTIKPRFHADRELLEPARRNSDRRVLADRKAPGRRAGCPDTGVATYRGRA